MKTIEKIVFVIIAFMLVSLNVVGETWGVSRTIEEGEERIVNDGLAIKTGVTITVKGTLTINGAVLASSSIGPSAGDVYIVGGGTVNIISSSYNLRLANNLHFENVTINYLTMGELNSGSEDPSLKYTLYLKDVTINGDFKNGYSTSSDVKNQPRTQIVEGSRVFVKGNLSNLGDIDCNGRLVVGTLADVPDGKTIIESNGTITNLGTININTSDEALARTQEEPIIENSIYYAAVTCDNLINGKNQTSKDIGTINMYDGSLIVQNDAMLWYKSKILFKKGQSYIDVWGDLDQMDKTYEQMGEEALIKLNGGGAKAQINVRDTFADWTTLDNARLTHDWDLDNNQFTINPNVALSVGCYYTAKTEYLDEHTTRTRYGNTVTSITKEFYSTQYSYVGDEISEYLERISDLTSEKSGLEDPDSDVYSSLVASFGEDAPEAAASRISEINEEIAALQAIVANLNKIQSFAKENISNSDLKNLNTWFYNTAYGKWFINQSLYIKSGNNYYSYKDYFYNQYINHQNSNDAQSYNHLKLYHYILAYMDAYGNDAQYYDARHNALSVMLPIELTYFTVEQVGDEVLCEWATESERDNDYFTVEYSYDGNNFHSGAVVDGAGNSTDTKLYNTTIRADKFSGVVYFRLKQTDFDGVSMYSEVKVLNVLDANNVFVVYPNPATSSITLLGGEYETVYFVDSQSKKYPALSLGSNQFSVENLSSGIHFAVIVTAKGTVVKEFMVAK